MSWRSRLPALPAPWHCPRCSAILLTCRRGFRRARCGHFRRRIAAIGGSEARSALGGRRPDRPLRPLPQLPRDLDRLTGQHELRGLEQDLVLRRADLGLDDLDREVLAAQVSRRRGTSISSRARGGPSGSAGGAARSTAGSTAPPCPALGATRRARRRPTRPSRRRRHGRNGRLGPLRLRLFFLGFGLRHAWTMGHSVRDVNADKKLRWVGNPAARGLRADRIESP